MKVDILDQQALNEALKGVDAVVNALGPSNHEEKTRLLDGVLASSAILYIPSEYGVWVPFTMRCSTIQLI